LVECESQTFQLLQKLAIRENKITTNSLNFIIHVNHSFHQKKIREMPRKKKEVSSPAVKKEVKCGTSADERFKKAKH
jgi:hypothetical protein